MGKRAATIEEVSNAALGLAAQRYQEVKAREEASVPAAPMVFLILGFSDEINDIEVLSLPAPSREAWATISRTAWRQRPEFLVYVCELSLETDGVTWNGVASAVYLSDGIGNGLPLSIVGIDLSKGLGEKAVRTLDPQAMPFTVPFWPSARRNLRQVTDDELEEATEAFLVATADGAEDLVADHVVAFGIGLGQRLERAVLPIAWFEHSELAGPFPRIATRDELHRLFALGADRVLIVSRTTHLVGSGSNETTLAIVRSAVAAGATPTELSRIDSVRPSEHESIVVGCFKLDGEEFVVERSWSLDLVDNAEWKPIERLEPVGTQGAVEIDA